MERRDQVSWTDLFLDPRFVRVHLRSSVRFRLAIVLPLKKSGHSCRHKEALWKEVRMMSSWSAAGMLRSAQRFRRRSKAQAFWFLSVLRKRRAEATPLTPARSEEHTSELQSLMRISYAVLGLKKNITK